MTTESTTDQAPARKAKPTVAEVARQHICTECGGPLPPRPPKQRGPRKQYCSDTCKKLRSNRRLVRGASIIEWAQAWRRARAQGEVAQRSLAQLCQILDQYNSEDHHAGRPPADLAAARMLMDGTMFCDRQRR